MLKILEKNPKGGPLEKKILIEKNMVLNGLKWLKMHFKHHFFFFEMWKMPGSGPPPPKGGFSTFF